MLKVTTIWFYSLKDEDDVYKKMESDVSILKELET